MLFRTCTTPISYNDCIKYPSTSESPLDTFVEIYLLISAFPWSIYTIPFLSILSAHWPHNSILFHSEYIGYCVRFVSAWSRITCTSGSVRRSCVCVWTEHMKWQFDDSHALQLDCTIPLYTIHGNGNSPIPIKKAKINQLLQTNTMYRLCQWIKVIDVIPNIHPKPIEWH